MNRTKIFMTEIMPWVIKNYPQDFLVGLIAEEGDYLYHMMKYYHEKAGEPLPFEREELCIRADGDTYKEIKFIRFDLGAYTGIIVFSLGQQHEESFDHVAYYLIEKGRKKYYMSRFDFDTSGTLAIKSVDAHDENEAVEKIYRHYISQL